MKIIWSPLALEQAEKIVDIIACDKPSAAQKWLDTVFYKIDLLETQPAMGRIVTEINNPKIREIIFGNYRIIYRTAADSIRILTIRSLKQIFHAIAIDEE